MKTIRELFRDMRFSVGAVLILVLAGLALASFFSPYDPTAFRVMPRDLPPSWEHLLGTNAKGQDVFWQLTFAVRNSLAVAILASLISRAIAITAGLTSGYRGGIADRLLMLISDGFMVMPLFLILILLTVAVGEMSMPILALILGVIAWPFDARLIRSQILSLREREFTYTAILSGIPPSKLVFSEYIPFIMPLILGTFIGCMGFAIGMEAGLAFLGLTDLFTPTLGVMIQWALLHQAMLLGLWWWLLPPVVTIVVLLLALYLISIGICEYLDPRARIQRVGVR